jgi:crossover junction endodeoxyribonuclease RusA
MSSRESVTTVELPWPPQVNHYYTVARGRKVLSKKGRLFKADCCLRLLAQKAPKNLLDRLRVEIEAYPPDRRKRDIDNIIKPTLDALQDYGLFDDSQIDDLSIRRCSAGKPGFVRIRIGALT